MLWDLLGVLFQLSRSERAEMIIPCDRLIEIETYAAMIELYLEKIECLASSPIRCLNSNHSACDVDNN